MIQSASPHAEDARGSIASLVTVIAQAGGARLEKAAVTLAQAQAVAQGATAQAILAVADELAALRQALRPNGADDTGATR
jgi:hypothetical protein